MERYIKETKMDLENLIRNHCCPIKINKKEATKMASQLKS